MVFNKFAIIIETKKILVFNLFLATRKETSSASEIIFSIVKVVDKVSRHNSIYSEKSDELSDFKNDIVQCGGIIQRVSEKELMTDQAYNNVQPIDESAKSRDFFQDSNPPGKNTRQQELNLETFFRILHMLV